MISISRRYYYINIINPRLKAAIDALNGVAKLIAKFVIRRIFNKLHVNII